MVTIHARKNKIMSVLHVAVDGVHVLAQNFMAYLVVLGF